MSTSTEESIVDLHSVYNTSSLRPLQVWESRKHWIPYTYGGASSASFKTLLGPQWSSEHPSCSYPAGLEGFIELEIDLDLVICRANLHLRNSKANRLNRKAIHGHNLLR